MTKIDVKSITERAAGTEDVIELRSMVQVLALALEQQPGPEAARTCKRCSRPVVWFAPDGKTPGWRDPGGNERCPWTPGGGDFHRVD